MATQMDQIRRLQINRMDESAPKQPAPGRWKPLWIGLAALGAIAAIVALWRSVSGPAAIEVDTAQARAELQDSSGLVLSATGYIVAHHRIDVNSKVTGRVAWFGVEKGDKVRAGQVLVRLENQEFQAQADQARGEVVSAQARLDALLAGRDRARSRQSA